MRWIALAVSFSFVAAYVLIAIVVGQHVFGAPWLSWQWYLWTLGVVVSTGLIRWILRGWLSSF